MIDDVRDRRIELSSYTKEGDQISGILRNQFCGYLLQILTV